MQVFLHPQSTRATEHSSFLSVWTYSLWDLQCTADQTFFNPWRRLYLLGIRWGAAISMSRQLLVFHSVDWAPAWVSAASAHAHKSIYSRYWSPWTSIKFVPVSYICFKVWTSTVLSVSSDHCLQFWVDLLRKWRHSQPNCQLSIVDFKLMLRTDLLNLLVIFCAVDVIVWVSFPVSCVEYLRNPEVKLVVIVLNWCRSKSIFILWITRRMASMWVIIMFSEVVQISYKQDQKGRDEDWRGWRNILDSAPSYTLTEFFRLLAHRNCCRNKS